MLVEKFEEFKEFKEFDKFKEFEEFEEFSDSLDEAEIIALTAAPPAGTPGVEPAGTPGTDFSPSALLAAKGEVAILRARLLALEETTQEERNRVASAAGQAQAAAAEQLAALAARNLVLENDKKVLHNQLRLRPHEPKRRKRETDALSDAPRAAMETVVTPARAARETPATPARAALVTVVTPDEGAALAQALAQHRVRGLPRGTMEYLARLTVAEPFEFKQCRFAPGEPVAAALHAFLTRRRGVAKLDHLVEETCQLLALLMAHLVALETLVAVPFLLALVHGTVRFRPNAVRVDVLVQLSHLALDLLDRYGHTLRHDPEAPSATPAPARLLQCTTVLFATELLEALVACGQPRGEPTAVWAAVPVAVWARLLSPHAPLNVTLLAVEMALMGAEAEMAPAKVLADERVLRPGFRLYGLNRALGSNADATRLDSMVPSAARNFMGSMLTAHPLPVLPEPTSTTEHRAMTMVLHLRVLDLLAARGVVDVATLRVLVTNAALHQEAVAAHPRARLTPTRLLLVSRTVGILHAVWHQVTRSELQLPRDTSHTLLVVLTRVAFSHTRHGLGEAAVGHVRQIREQQGSRQPLFNAEAEERARLMAGVTALSPIKEVCEAELAIANGLEFAYEDRTIGLAREILETHTTGPEADNLYSSMNEDPDEQ